MSSYAYVTSSFETSREQGRIPRCDEAQAKQMLEPFAAPAGHVAVFILHWWRQTEAGHPDHTEGETARIKFRTVVRGVELIWTSGQGHGLDRCGVGGDD